MDVETVQKINDLALNLQQQGNMSKDEALQQAQEMISKEDNLEVNEISSKKLEEIEETPQEKPIEMTWQQAMEKNTKFIVNEFKDIQKEIINLKSEMENLRHQIKNIKISPPAPQPEQKPVQEKLPKETTSEEKHPKQGDVKPNEFAVEKMFYCGTK